MEKINYRLQQPLLECITFKAFKELKSLELFTLKIERKLYLELSQNLKTPLLFQMIEEM